METGLPKLVVVRYYRSVEAEYDEYGVPLVGGDDHGTSATQNSHTAHGGKVVGK